MAFSQMRRLLEELENAYLDTINELKEKLAELEANM